VAVKVRECASRRAVKQAVDEAAAEARAQLVAWYNQQVGASMVQYARLGRGRRIRSLDTTHVEVALETGTYECSGVVKNDDGTYSRGYELATLRTRLTALASYRMWLSQPSRATIWRYVVPCWSRLACCALAICSSKIGLS
jgi:hypothetical protein